MARTERRAGATAQASATTKTAVRHAVLVLAALAAVLAMPSAAAAAQRTAGPAHAAAATAPRADREPLPGPSPSPGTGSPGSPGTSQPNALCSVVTYIPQVKDLCTQGQQQAVNSVNNLCSPGPPSPEQADGGIDSMVRPPSSATSGGQPRTLYQSYGMAGESWAPYDLKCSDMTSMMGNTVASAVFDAAKATDRLVISTYQAAAGEGLLDWLKTAVDRLITQIGSAVYFPYLAPVVLLGAVWLAWQGLVRRRATRTLEGTVWMVVACVAAIWLIGRPADFTGVGQKVSDGVTQVLNVAFSRLPVGGSSGCVPVQAGDPQSSGENFAYTGSNTVVAQNADELWSVLDCRPWLAGEFGTSSATGSPGDPASKYGRQLLWSQAIAVNEQPTSNLITQKTDTYVGIANALQKNYPAVYPLFQGKQWPTRLEIGFSALFAALIAGVLVLLISVTLIILKIGFLLLLVAGPFFLIIGTHPGAGRVIAIRWFELLVGVLMKQVAVALALSVLLYAYALVMATSDNVLPWALKILMIALLTVAVFIYRRPFQHLFTSVGYQALGARDRADVDLARARSGFRARTLETATATLPGFGNYRVNRWARRNPDQADQAKYLAGRIASAVTPGAGGTAAAAGQSAGKGGQDTPDLAADGAVGADGGRGRPAGTRVSGSRGAAGGAGVGGGPGGGGRAEPPPLNLPRRPGQGGAGWDGGRAGPAGRGAAGTAAGAGGTAPPRWQPGPYLPARPGGTGTGPGGASAGQQRRASASAREAEASARRAEASSRRAEASGRRAEGSARQAETRSRQSDARSQRAEANVRKPASWVRPIRRDK